MKGDGKLPGKALRAEQWNAYISAHCPADGQLKWMADFYGEQSVLNRRKGRQWTLIGFAFLAIGVASLWSLIVDLINIVNK